MTDNMSQVSRSGNGESADGRHQRRHRNREAAISALIALLDEGHVYPTVADVAARSGLSARSMFRYFEDVADLQREAMARLARGFAPELATLSIDPSRPLAQRIDATAHALDRVYGIVRTAATAARLRLPDNPDVLAQVSMARAVIRGYVSATFEPELKARRGKARAQLQAALDVWATFEVQHVLRELGPVEGADPVKVTILGLTALLGEPA